jgi:SAM-dependent methyltransferase
MNRAMRAISLGLQQARNRIRAARLRSDWRKRNAATKDSVDTDYLKPLRSRCRYCESATSRLLGKVPLTFRQALTLGDYRLAQCEACEVVYLDPEPPPDDLRALYVGSSQFPDARDLLNAQSARTAKSYERRLQYLDLLPGPGDAILEVGAGPAWVCRAAKKRCPDVTTIAQDISDECAADCPWVDNYIVGDLARLPPQRSIRLAALTHVIEHLPRPQAFLQDLAAYMAPGGKVYITAPFRPARWNSEDGFGPWLDYSYLHVPAHISYLSGKWMRAAAAESGFEVIRWDASIDGYQVFETVLQRLG